MLYPMDIDQVLDSAIAQLKNKLSRFKVVRLQENLPEVKLNAAKLEQVFLNVINNSIETMENSGELLIKTSQVKDKIQILISDHGTGIAQKNLAKVFDPLFTTKETKKGTGLGLSICHGIIEQHGGTITLKNHKWGGVDTTIHLPIP